MTTMQCTEFEEILDQQPDGPLPAAALSHLHSCPHCGALMEELGAIRAAGRELGASEPAPPVQMWTLLRAQLESEGLIREAKRPAWFAEWFGLSPRFAVAGASVALLVIAGSLVSFQSAPPAAMRLDRVRPNLSLSAGPVGVELNRTLDGDLARVVASLSERDASLATSVQKNLGIVDNLIVMCEKSVRENPGNQMARDYLYGAYQQKAALLAAATERSTLENQ
jgi:anti-sigma factor RsiW